MQPEAEPSTASELWFHVGSAAKQEFGKFNRRAGLGVLVHWTSAEQPPQIYSCTSLASSILPTEAT